MIYAFSNTENKCDKGHVGLNGFHGNQNKHNNETASTSFVNFKL